MTRRNQVRVAGLSIPAAASGSTPARTTRAPWRKSISTAWIALMMMATMPSTTTTAGLAPFRVSTLVSRDGELAAGRGLQDPRGPGVPGPQQQRRQQHAHRRGGGDDHEPGADIDERVRLAGQGHPPARDDHAEHGNGDGEREDPLLELADGGLTRQVR